MPRRQPLTCIDLFAGCGGLSLGLERAGFKPLLFCELSDHAAETYSWNNPGIPRFRDAVKLAQDLKKAVEPNKPLRVTSLDGVEVSITPGEVDLVCGGPPCQGYSRIGHRRTHKLQKEEIPSNHLFKSMVKIIASTNPKMFLFENVSGILSGKWTSGGMKGEIFKDVLLGADGFGGLMAEPERPAKITKERVCKGYLVRWAEIKSSDYGVPQNRPRVLVVGIREDLAPDFPRLGRKASGVKDLEDVARRLIPASKGRYAFTPAQALGDLAKLPRKEDASRSSFAFSDARRPGSFERVQEELRNWYLASKGEWLAGRPAVKEGEPPLENQEYSRHSEDVIERFKLIRSEGLTMAELNARGKGTKKFSQRALNWTVEGGPNITITSLPDDLVHFSENRILTVREWARLQTFPDWFVFKGPRTTGGSRRAGNPSQGNWHRDVPQYTQIGNAVPVALAYALGAHFSALLGEH